MGLFTPRLVDVMRYEHDTGDGFKIGLADYPIHNDDPARRLLLNQLIIDEYLNREIGLESVPLFVHRLGLKMRQIMPYFNKLYASEEIQFGPLDTFNLRTERNDTSHDTGSNSADGGSKVTSTSGARNVNSDTPQVQLAGDEDYATFLTDANSAAESDTTSNQATTSQSDGTLDAISTTTGYQGAASGLLQQYRQTFLNINMMIVPELNELFMLVRGNGSEYFPQYLGDSSFYFDTPRLGSY